MERTRRTRRARRAERARRTRTRSLRCAVREWCGGGRARIHDGAGVPSRIDHAAQRAKGRKASIDEDSINSRTARHGPRQGSVYPRPGSVPETHRVGSSTGAGRPNRTLESLETRGVLRCRPVLAVPTECLWVACQAELDVR